MIDLFSTLPGYDRGIVSVPQFIYVKEGLQKAVDKLTAYYHEAALNVRNEHILVKLINSLNVSLNRDFVNYLDVAADNAMNVSRVMGFTSSTVYGRVFERGYFYGDGVKEILILDDTVPEDLSEASDWKSLMPVRVLRHPFTDMSLDIPDGTYNGSNEGGLAVISINVPTLLAQYRGWHFNEKFEGQAIDTIHQFVRRYPITNMLSSHLDVALFNRMDALFRGEPVAKFRSVHPTPIIDYTERLDDVLRRYLDIMHRHREMFDQTLLHMPVVCAPTMLHAMRLPQILALRQVKWALILARLPLIRFLVKLDRETDNPMNTAYINRIRMSVRQIKNDRTITTMIGPDLYEEFRRGIAEDIVPGTDYWEA